MFLSIIFLVLIRYCSNSLANNDLTKSFLPQIDGRIIGGVPINIRQHPYQVSVQIGQSHICGGTLYTQNTVITAAHCMEKAQLSQLTIHLGSSYHFNGGMSVSVNNIIIHPSYNPKTMENDIAILRLASPVRLGVTIQTIEIANRTPPPSTQAIVTGWGVLFEKHNRIPIRLQKVTVATLSNSECSSPPFDYTPSQIGKTMLCAFASNKDACQGDSGGPLVANGKLIGIVSWGYGCARKNYPGVYTNVAAFYNWIISNMNSN